MFLIILVILGISNNINSRAMSFIVFLFISEKRIHVTLIHWLIILLFGGVGLLFYSQVRTLLTINMLFLINEPRLLLIPYLKIADALMDASVNYSS